MEIAANIYHAQALLAAKLDETDRQLTFANKALSLYRQIDDELGAALAEGTACSALMRLGRSKEAETALQRTLAGMRSLTTRKHFAYILRLLGQAYLANGDVENARRTFAEVMQICDDLKASRLAAITQGGCIALPRSPSCKTICPHISLR